MDCHQNETVETTLTIQKRIFNELKKIYDFVCLKKERNVILTKKRNNGLCAHHWFKIQLDIICFSKK